VKKLLIILLLSLLPTSSPTITKKSTTEYLFTALKVQYVLLQVADITTTIYATQNGAKELNPLIKPFAKIPPAFVLVKAGLTYYSLKIANESFKENKTETIITMIVVNAVYSYVVYHNVNIIVRIR